MRRQNLSLLLAALLVASCAGKALHGRTNAAVLTADYCDTAAPRALIARPSDMKTSPDGLRLLAASALRLMEAKYVAGPCADDIVEFVAGNARLRSGEIFVVSDDGTVKLYPPQGLIERHALPAGKISGLPGYSLVMTEELGRRSSPAGERKIYLGLFEGKLDFLIARFDVINGRPSRNAVPLIRSTSTITAMGFLGAPDTQEGSIGFVVPVGKDAAWLYAFNWDHGEFSQLP
jgi:hypothetical protein